MRDNGYRYLVVSRGGARHFDVQQTIRIRTIGDDVVQLHKQVSEVGEEGKKVKEVQSYSLSERRAKKGEGISQRFTERFEAALNKLSEGLSIPRMTKNIDKLWERIGRLKGKEPWDWAAIPDWTHSRRRWPKCQRTSLATDPGQRQSINGSRGLLFAQFINQLCKIFGRE